MSEFTCFKCGDGSTPLYCLNCANEIAGSELNPASGSPFPSGIEETWRADAAELRAALFEAEITRLRESLYEIYNSACFDWDSMPESGRERFQSVVIEMAGEALSPNQKNKHD